MTTSAIIMMLIGVGCTWGGAVYCVLRALKSRQQGQSLPK